MAKKFHGPLDEFGEKVRKRRKELDWTQEKLAAESGLHTTYISSIECGDRNVSLINILKIAKALGVQSSDLLKGVSL